MFPTELVDLIVSFSPPELLIAFTMVSKRYSKLFCPEKDVDYLRCLPFNEDVFEGEIECYYDYKQLAMYKSPYTEIEYIEEYVMDFQSIKTMGMDQYFLLLLDSESIVYQIDDNPKMVLKKAIKKDYYYYLYLLAFSKERVDWLISNEVYMFDELKMLKQCTSVEACKYIYDKHLEKGIEMYDYVPEIFYIISLPKDIFFWFVGVGNIQMEEIAELIDDYLDQAECIPEYDNADINTLVYLYQNNFMRKKQFLSLINWFNDAKDFETIYKMLDIDLESLIDSNIGLNFFAFVYRKKKKEDPSLKLTIELLERALYNRQDFTDSEVDENDRVIMWILQNMSVPRTTVIQQLDYPCIHKEAIKIFLEFYSPFSKLEKKLLLKKAAMCDRLKKALKDANIN